MKKITTLMLMLMGCAFSALAQTVASTTTDPSNITEGYYVLLAKTSEGTKTDANGNFVYYNSSDNKIYYDAIGSNTSLIGQSVESVDLFKYFFYIKNTNGKLTIQAWNTNTFWPSVGNPTKIPINYNPGQVSQISQASSLNEFTISDVSGTWLALSFPGSYYEKWTSRDTTPTTDYVVLNSDQQVGYWDAASNAKAQFQFYAVNDVPSAKDLVTFTYNYTFNGVTKATSPQARIGVVGRAYPEIDNVLPDFIVPSKPNGIVKASDNNQSIEIVCSENLPFQTSTDANPIYYYLENVQGEGTRLFSNNGLAYRASAQAENVNGVRDDLWYVTGNAWDGFEFHNVGENNTLKSSAIMSHSYLCTLSFSNVDFANINKCATNWEVYKVLSGNNQVFGVLPHNSTTGAGSKEFSWKWDGTDINFNVPNDEDDACAFRLVPATFTFPMYSGNDGNTYNTFAAPFDVALADEESDVKMYKGAVDAAEKELVLSEVSAVPAGAGVMLMGKNSQAENVTLKAVAGAQALEGNDLVGITEAINGDILRDILILGVSNETGEVGFFSASNSVVSLNANHAYLNKTSTSGIKGVSMRLEGEATALGRIEANTNDKANDALYDLTGRRVSHVERGGLYIQNGRKFIAK